MNAEYTGKKIAELRKEKNLTQKELASVLDSTPSILLGLEAATKEEIVNSFAEISNQQSEEAEKEIQQIGWINLFACILLWVFVEAQDMSWLINALLGAIMGAAAYTLKKYKAIKQFELLDEAQNASVGDVNVYMHDEDDLFMTDVYGFWEVSCYPSENMVEFDVGGKGLVSNSTYWGFYYSSDNTHKVFQGADIPLNVNKDLADWYGEGDNWGKSIRLIDKWFWFEASF